LHAPGAFGMVAAMGSRPLPLSPRLRRGEPADAAAAAPLLLSTGPGPMAELFGAGSVASALRFLDAAFQQERGVFSHRHSFVATRGPAVIGLSMVLPLEAAARHRRAVFWQILRHHRCGAWARVLLCALRVSRAMPPAPRRGAYVACVAVAPEGRGLGVGDWLLAACEARAREEGARALYAHVAADNGSCLRMLHRHAFTVLRRGAGPDGGDGAALPAQLLFHKELTPYPGARAASAP
jgi:ribosomal protein S18 acetylase RimI-like enzyme